MLLWRRNLKYFHYSLNTLPVDVMLIWRVFGLVFCVLVPYFISYAMGRYWDEYRMKSIETTVHFDEAILIARNSKISSSEIYFLNVNGHSSTSYDLKIRNESDQFGLQITIPQATIDQFELFVYLTLPAFQTTPQMFYSEASAAVPASGAIVRSEIR